VKKFIGSSQLLEGEPQFDRDLFVNHLDVPDDLRKLRGSARNRREIEDPEEEEEQSLKMTKEFIWTIQSLTKDEMDLQLDFASTSFISFDDIDAIVFQF